MTNLEIINEYVEMKLGMADNKSKERTALQYGVDIKKILSFHTVLDCKKVNGRNEYSDGEMSILDMTKKDYLKVATKVWVNHKNKQTRNKYLLIYRSFLKFLDENEMLTCKIEDILKSDKLRIESTKGDIDNGTVAMPYEKFEDFRDWLLELSSDTVQTQRKKVAILLEMMTGLRPSELLTLEVSNINFDTNEILVVDTKGGKPRTTKVMTTPMNEISRLLYLYSITDGYNEDDTYLFRVDSTKSFQGNKASGHMKYQNYNKLIHSVMDMAVRHGIIEEDETTTGHGLRKLFASYLVYKKEMKPSTVAKLLGHSNMDTILRYIKPRNEKVLEELEDALEF